MSKWFKDDNGLNHCIEPGCGFICDLNVDVMVAHEWSHKIGTGQQVVVSSANQRQIGGSHYKDKAIQPWDAILDWHLGYLDGTAIKYLARWQQKNGIEDLKKAAHYLEKLIEVESAKAK